MIVGVLDLIIQVAQPSVLAALLISDCLGVQIEQKRCEKSVELLSAVSELRERSLRDNDKNGSVRDALLVWDELSMIGETVVETVVEEEQVFPT